MLHQKITFVKNKKGSLTKIFREQYLRDDIHCGHMNCQSCSSKDPNKRFSWSDTIWILDIHTCIHQIDLIEHISTENIIILRTVLDAVREHSMVLYQKLRALAKDENRKFFVFSNEFHKDLYRKRIPNENLENYRHRLILNATLFYQNHFKDIAKIYLLSSHSDLIQNAQQEHVNVMDLTQYVQYKKLPELLDLIVDEESEEPTETFEYPSHLSSSALIAGLKSQKYVQGKLSISHHNVFEGSIHATLPNTNQEQTIYISGRNNLNRAVHEDIVVVELLAESNTVEELIDEEGEATEIEPQTIPAVSTNSVSGRVVGIVKRNWRSYAGAIDASQFPNQMSAQSVHCWFYPVDKRIPRIRIRTRQLDHLRDKRILVSIDEWNTKQLYPKGHYIRTLGPIEDKETILQSILHEHDIQSHPFSDAILKELPQEGENWQIPLEEREKRADFTSLPICSIDPPGCTDIDDALHARRLPNGNIECGVHIADVTHFVKPQTHMDQEAMNRSTTVYLVQQRIDMLPPLLGTHLCSLHQHVERLAFSVLWELTPEGELVQVMFTKSIIKSRHSFTYQEAQMQIDDPQKTDELTESMRLLNDLAKKMRKKRMERGSLTLSSPEVRFQLEHDSQDPVDVELKELQDTNALVEEFMLLANISVARKIWETFPEVAVLRRHPKPPQSNFEKLKSSLERMGFDLKTFDSKQLSDSLDQCRLNENPYFNTLVRIMTTRCMMQAVYFCSGSLPETDYWHYGLACDIYTHFTSPIRRYADVLVHRLLTVCLDSKQIPQHASLFDRVKMDQICQHMNHRHHLAQQASRNSVELYTHLFFKKQEKACVEEAYIIRVLKNGVGVLVPKYGVEGFVMLKDDLDYQYDPESNQMISQQKPALSIFTRVKVKITMHQQGVAGLRQRLQFELVE